MNEAEAGLLLFGNMRTNIERKLRTNGKDTL